MAVMDKKRSVSILRSVSVIMVVVMLLSVFQFSVIDRNDEGRVDNTSTVYGATEVRGLWIAYVDFEKLGLKDKSESVYRQNVNKFLKEAKKYGTNTIYFHVRAFDDASWKSPTFKASVYLDSDASSGKTANKVYTYDPLQIVIEEGHKLGMEVHAWLNPYRISHDYFWDPAPQKTTDRILTAVDELLEYDIDGIHFDDYFYNAKKGYKRVGSSTVYKAPDKATRRVNVNKMVLQVYKRTHTKSGVVFGISPQGNYDNSMGSGADLDTWLSKCGYIDYLVPQIYWTDYWGSDGTVKMFTNRMNLFKQKNKIGIPMYLGLALYRTGYEQSDDRGWGWYNNNIATQVKKLRSAGMNGYVLFSARDLYDPKSKAERNNLLNLISPVPVESVKMKYGKRTVLIGFPNKLSCTVLPSNATNKTVTYSSSHPYYATVNSKTGVVKGVRPGKATIRARTSNGKVSSTIVYVKYYRVKATKRMSVRSKPSTSSKKIKTYKAGTVFIIDKKSGKWGKLRGYNNRWIYLPSTKMALQ